MIQFIVPIISWATGLFVAKSLAEQSVSESITDGISEAVYEAVDVVEGKMIRGIFLTIISAVVYIVILVMAVYLLPLLFDKKIAIYVVCGAYLVSILCVVVKFPVMLKFIFVHKLSLKNCLRDKIHSEVPNKAHYETNNMNLFKQALNEMFEKSSSSIAYSTTRKVIKKARLLVVVLIVSTITVYVIIPIMLVTPTLIENTTMYLDVFQATLYPLLYTVDFFFGTNVLSWLI
jgi:uncharacterized BrkB/YihY/UPF0761 family membrane protein